MSLGDEILPLALGLQEDNGMHGQPAPVTTLPWKQACTILLTLCFFTSGACIFLWAAGQPPIPQRQAMGNVRGALNAAEVWPAVQNVEWKVKKAETRARVNAALWCWKKRIYGVHCDPFSPATLTTTTTVTKSLTSTSTKTGCVNELGFSFMNQQVNGGEGYITGIICGLVCGVRGNQTPAVFVSSNSASPPFGVGEYTNVISNAWRVAANCRVEYGNFYGFSEQDESVGAALRLYASGHLGSAGLTDQRVLAYSMLHLHWE